MEKTAPDINVTYPNLDGIQSPEFRSGPINSEEDQIICLMTFLSDDVRSVHYKHRNVKPLSFTIISSLCIRCTLVCVSSINPKTCPIGRFCSARFIEIVL